MLTACGQYHLADSVWFFPEEMRTEVEHYLDYREQYLGSRRVNYRITLEFGVLPEPIIGRCITKYSSDGYKSKYIVIDREEWITMVDLDREQLLFHEFGHCDLDKSHTDHLSIMYPYQLYTSYYKLHREEFIRELFLN